MSHTLRLDSVTTCHYNSDLSGNVTVIDPYNNVTLPIWQVLAIAAEFIRQLKINELESQNRLTILGINNIVNHHLKEDVEI